MTSVVTRFYRGLIRAASELNTLASFASNVIAVLAFISAVLYGIDLVPEFGAYGIPINLRPLLVIGLIILLLIVAA